MRWEHSANLGRPGFVQARLISDHEQIEAEVVKLAATSYYVDCCRIDKYIPTERYQSLEQAKAAAVVKVRFHYAGRN